ncbi:hypothetical protein A3B51_03670 [Candidatus Curtissbacteria bacterium RIFCSPLOWO2_01_FULL_41_18]|uniref:PsbP C-terminal domain-containing protein n=1 Tax=Candidatus Curtissbacteria bacterium RIFCSPLOWO2_01_FULL_41_18 TaxID=1797727 RepID=A0A1F5HK81_9BACT|nr:MAG: hypothetical protein A3B51_03670 [Candidatus Curtissbacteria bacterium RIFCSPLOWO2_01_FULL_41_18]
MTLHVFKRKITKGFVIVFLIFYGLLFYSVGKYEPINKLFKSKVNSIQKITNSSLEKPLPYADTQTPEVIGSHVKLCANTVYGYQLAYPGDWFTTYNSDDQKCRFFAPYSFVITKLVEDSFAPIEIEVIPPWQWENTVKFYENPNEFYNVLSSQNVEIADKIVKKIETASTGSATIPRGFTKVTYLVLDAKIPLRISYVQLESTDNVNGYKDDLKQIVESLKYF